MAKDELDKLLLEATANENWSISNSKLLNISDATYNPSNVEKTGNFLLQRLESKPHEWRRVLKTLNAIEFII